MELGDLTIYMLSCAKQWSTEMVIFDHDALWSLCTMYSSISQLITLLGEEAFALNLSLSSEGTDKTNPALKTSQQTGPVNKQV